MSDWLLIVRDSFGGTGHYRAASDLAGTRARKRGDEMNSFASQSQLKSGDHAYEIFRLDALATKGVKLGRLPYSLRILLENLLRHEDGKSVTADDIEFLANWDPKATPSREIAYMPARVLM